MNFTDETVLIGGTSAVSGAVRTATTVTSASGDVTGSSQGVNLYVENALDQSVTLHLDYSRDRGATWHEFDSGTAITVAAGVADLRTADKALLVSFGLLRVRAVTAVAPTQGNLLVALHVNRRS